MQVVTCVAPVNIALVKYWGKRDETRILPTNSSLSVTLKSMISTTSILLGKDGKDVFFLNGKEAPINSRTKTLLSLLRAQRRVLEASSAMPVLSSLPLVIASSNNFPTAAGLASSASGFACLAFSLATLYQLPLDHTLLSSFARQGSGSACRSLFGGFVTWDMGVICNGPDSVARQVAPHSHWPELCALILVANAEKKEVSSTNGMQNTVKTSSLFALRPEIANERVKKMEKAILDKNFDVFAEITMMDSNQFHAVCLDTFPPIFYLNEVSKKVIEIVTRFNTSHETQDSKYKVAYTFDAGPNAVLYTRKDTIPELLRSICEFFPKPCDLSVEEYFGDSFQFISKFSTSNSSIKSDDAGIKRIFYSEVGEGPRCLGDTFEVSLFQKDGSLKNSE